MTIANPQDRTQAIVLRIEQNLRDQVTIEVMQALTRFCTEVHLPNYSTVYVNFKGHGEGGAPAPAGVTKDHKDALSCIAKAIISARVKDELGTAVDAFMAKVESLLPAGSV